VCTQTSSQASFAGVSFFPQPFLERELPFWSKFVLFSDNMLEYEGKLKAYDVVMQIWCITMEVRWRILPVCHTDQAQCYWYFCTLGSLVVFSFLCSFWPCHCELPNCSLDLLGWAALNLFRFLLFLCYCKLPNFVI